MFRAIVYQRSNLDLSQVADFGIISASIKEDLTQKATSTIKCQVVPSNVNIDDLLLIYDSKGTFVYWGIITSIDDLTIKCSQFQSLFNDKEMIVAQTSTNQKAFYNNSTISNIVKFYLSAKTQGYANIVNTMSATYVPSFSGLKDSNVVQNFKSVNFIINDNELTYAPFPTEKSEKNLETFLYETFNQYNRIIRPFYSGTIGTRLPSGYTELESITSSGAQYIDTLFTPSPNTSMKIKFTQTNNGNSYQSVWGIRTGSNSNDFQEVRTSSAATIRMGGGSSYNVTVTSALTFGAEHTIEITPTSLKIDTTDFTASINPSFTPPNPLVLFAIRTNSTISQYSNATLKYCKLYDGEELVRDFVPCKRDSDSAIGLFDLVDGQFYANKGTGTFTAGAEIPSVEARALNIVCMYPSGTITPKQNVSWDYNSKNLFDTWECITNVNITKEDEDVNTVYVYSSDGATLRGAYTIKKNGDIVPLTTGMPVANRLGSNKTKFIYDSDNVVLDLAKSELPSLQYNHKITFDISFLGEYKKDDFNLGMPIKFYSTSDNTLRDSLLTAWSYSIEENSDVINNASFTLGKVRNSLTAKLNKDKL